MRRAQVDLRHTPYFAWSQTRSPRFNYDRMPTTAGGIAFVFGALSALFGGISFVVMFSLWFLVGTDFKQGYLVFTTLAGLAGGGEFGVIAFLASIVPIHIRLSLAKTPMRVGSHMIWIAFIYGSFGVACVNHSNHLAAIWLPSFPLVIASLPLRSVRMLEPATPR